MNLFQAVKSGSQKDLEYCLAHKESVSMIDNRGLTALHWAAILGNLFAIHRLVEHGAAIDAPGTRLKVTPLHLAAFKNNSDSVDALLSLGANIDAKSAQGATVLDLIFSLNENHDSMGGLTKFLPFVKLAEKTNYAFDAFISLLAHNPEIKDMKKFEKIMFNALVHDRVDVLKAIHEKEYHYGNLQKDISIMVGGIELPFDMAIGYDYALIIAMSNGAINCLKYIHFLNPQCFMAKEGSISQVTNSNLLHWMAQQMPETAMFNAVVDFIKLQESQKIELATAHANLPSALRDYSEDICFNYDINNQRYYISSALIGGCALYFDETGQPKEIEKRLKKIEEVLAYFRDQHGILVTGQDKLGEYVGQYILKCPLEIMQIFIDFGVTFKGKEFHRALRVQTADVIKAMIPVSDVCWKNEAGQSALDILTSSVNDALLNEMPTLIQMIQQKQVMVLSAPLEFSDRCVSDCLSSTSAPLTPTFRDIKNNTLPAGEKVTNEYRSDVDDTIEQEFHVPQP